MHFHCSKILTNAAFIRPFDGAKLREKNELSKFIESLECKNYNKKGRNTEGGVFSFYFAAFRDVKFHCAARSNQISNFKEQNLWDFRLFKFGSLIIAA
jgi:hypothetical protein